MSCPKMRGFRLVPRLFFERAKQSIVVASLSRSGDGRERQGDVCSWDSRVLAAGDAESMPGSAFSSVGATASFTALLFIAPRKGKKRKKKKGAAPRCRVVFGVAAFSSAFPHLDHSQPRCLAMANVFLVLLPRSNRHSIVHQTCTVLCSKDGGCELLNMA